MIRFYFNPSPNPLKIALLLEEIGDPYEPVPVDARRGEQFRPSYLAINPNGKVPAIADGDVIVLDSNAILLYIAEKYGKFLPLGDQVRRGALLSWLMFVATGVGPFCGQAVHFKHFAPEPMPYANDRYQYEAERHFRVADARLGAQRYMLGEEYSIVDMALWGWARMIPYVLGEGAWLKFSNLRRLIDEISNRPAALRALALPERFAWKEDIDQEVRRHFFKHVGGPPEGNG